MHVGQLLPARGCLSLCLSLSLRMCIYFQVEVSALEIWTRVRDCQEWGMWLLRVVRIGLGVKVTCE